MKIYSIIYGVFSILCIIFGDYANVMGAWFLYLFFYTWDNPRGLVFLGALACLAITGKFIICQYTYFEYIKYMWAYYFIIGLSLYLTWQKKHDIFINMIENADKTNQRILEHLNAGSDVRTIAQASYAWKWLNKPLTQNAIRKRIRKMMLKADVKNLFQLGWKLGRKKQGLNKPD